jgi:hypothetical protein
VGEGTNWLEGRVIEWIFTCTLIFVQQPPVSFSNPELVLVVLAFLNLDFLKVYSPSSSTVCCIGNGIHSGFENEPAR